MVAMQYEPLNSIDWADYIHHGSDDFVIKHQSGL